MANVTLILVGDDRSSLELVGAELTGMGYAYRIFTPAPAELFLPFSTWPKELKTVADDKEDLIVVVEFSTCEPAARSKEYYIELIRSMMACGAACDYIVIADRETKVQAMRSLGPAVWAYLERPFDSSLPVELGVIIGRIEGFTGLRREVGMLARKLSHIEVLNTITRELLLEGDENDLLWYLARVIHEKFNFFNVNIFLINESGGRVVLKAFAGGFAGTPACEITHAGDPGNGFVVGYSLALGEGMVGWVAQNRQSLLIGDVRKDSRRIQGFAFEEHVLSELAVPVIFEQKVLGVIHVESEELNAFTRDDMIVLETVADQIALSLEKTRLSRELLVSQQLYMAMNDSLPVSIVIVNSEFKIEWVNRTFQELYGIKREDFNQPVLKYFPSDLALKINMDRELRLVLETGVPVSHGNISYTFPDYLEKVITISMVRIQVGTYSRVMILIQDVTDFTNKAYQLSLLREISIAMEGVFERDKLLHLILTCVTAGFAMGFNRAFLFLMDRGQTELRGIMGVGPTSREEAYRIWSELSRKALTFKDYLENVNRGLMVRSGLQGLVENIAVDLSESRNILTETVKNGTVIHVTNAWEHPLMDDIMHRLVISSEFVAVPLIVKNEVIGALLADNAFSGRPITEDSIEVLTMFATQAAIAIENAEILGHLEEKVLELEEAYRNLEKAQDIIIRNEKLAAVGEVSARLAHEIRNPLATIGGFAKSIQKKYNDRERTIRNANIIVEEVLRLEHILSNVLDFTKTGAPKKTPGDINELIRKTLSMMEGNILSNGVVVVLDLAKGALNLDYDKAQIKQVLINLFQNAISAMPEGGALEIRTLSGDHEIRIEIRDTGVGIPSQHLENIFEPFFTTRGNGTGLGLSISHRIVQNHGGRLELTSKEGTGTTVLISLPRG